MPSLFTIYFGLVINVNSHAATAPPAQTAFFFRISLLFQAVFFFPCVFFVGSD